MGEALRLLAKPIGVELFHGIHDACMDVVPALAENPIIGHVVREGMLESVLRQRKELRRMEKLAVLQVA